MFDVSIFKNIDFSKPDTVIFLGISALIFLVVITVLFLAVRFIFRLLKIFLRRIFKRETHYANIDQGSDLGVHVSQLEEAKAEREKFEEQKKFAKSPTMENNFQKAKTEEQKKAGKETFEQKEQKGIQAGLDKLKTGNGKDDDSLESKMPSRDGKEEDRDAHEKIRIPRPRHFSQISSFSSSAGGEQIAKEESKGSDKEDSGAEKTEKDQSGNIPKTPGIKMPSAAGFGGNVGLAGHAGAKMPSGTINSGPNANIAPHINAGGQQKVPGQPDVIKMPSSQAQQAKLAETVFFGKDKEVSRIKLENRLRKDEKIWKATKQEGLNLSQAERAKLVKEVFSPVYGRNISKKDLVLSVKKLNQKLVGTKDAGQHAKLRKEIKFFKKVGGIKGNY
jgi:hypothetical protein